MRESHRAKLTRAALGGPGYWRKVWEGNTVKRRACILSVSAVLVLLSCGRSRSDETAGKAPAADADEWVLWRGSSSNGYSPHVPRTMPDLKLLWKKRLAGSADSPLAATRDYVIVSDHKAEQADYIRCFKAASGDEAWVFEYPNAVEMDYGAAPRNMPIIYQEQVYVVSAVGNLYCLDLKTGKVQWRQSYVKDYKSEVPTWGFCVSPMIVDGKLIIFPGGSHTLHALDPKTGKVIWNGRGAGINYAGFIVATLGGVKQLIGYDMDSLAGWDVKTGRRLWSIPAASDGGYIVPTPLPVGDKLLIADPKGTLLFAFDKEGKLIKAPVGENEDLCPEMASPVVLGDMVVGVSDGVVALDPNDKLKTLWLDDQAEEPAGMTHLVASKDRAMAFSGSGTMVLIAADRRKLRILGQKKLCGDTYVHPAIAGGRLFVQDKKGMAYCYELKPSGN